MNARSTLVPSAARSAALAAAATVWLGLHGFAQDGSGAKAPSDAPERSAERPRGERGAPPSGSARGEVPRFDGPGRERWGSLGDEEKERLRAALREVWTDPQVISAREEVQQASEAYRSAVREAMGRLDPSVVPLLQEMQKEGEGRSRERLGSGPPGPPGFSGPKGRAGYRSPDFSPAGPPGFLERFPPAEQERFRQAEAKAQRSDRVESARSRLSELREQDESLRKERFEAHLDLRRGLFEEILAEDPGLSGMVETLQRQVEPSRSQRGPRDEERGGPRGQDGESPAGRDAEPSEADSGSRER